MLTKEMNFVFDTNSEDEIYNIARYEGYLIHQVLGNSKRISLTLT
jgi:hypothetical protein